MLEAISKRGVALPIQHAFDRKSDRLSRSNKDGKLLGSRQSRIQEIPTQKQVMLHEQGHDDHWILAPLTFVNGDGPGKREFGEIGVVIADGSLVGKLHHHLLLFQIDAGHRSQIAVKDFPLVVIDLLDHPITPGLQATYALLDANEAGHTIQFRRVDYDHEGRLPHGSLDKGSGRVEQD